MKIRGVPAAILGMLVFFSPAAAHAFDEAREKQVVKELFEQGLPQAYASLQVERVLDFYAETALILTHSMGRGDKSRFRELLQNDLERIKKIEEASWEVETLSFANEVAAAKVRIREKIVDHSGDTFNRGATFYYRLAKIEDSWKIFLQSYREDFELEPTGGFHRRRPSSRGSGLQ